MSEQSKTSIAAEELLVRKFKRISLPSKYIAGFVTVDKYQLALERCRDDIYLWTEPVSNLSSDSIKTALKRRYFPHDTRSSALNAKNCNNLVKGNAVDYWVFESLQEFEAFLDWYQTISSINATEIKSFVDLKTERRIRLANANKKPEKRIIQTEVFIRNPDVVAEVLDRANGFCEKCHHKAPFLKKSDNSPYFEVHHKIRLADGGDDTVENAIALCPNCHREAHFG